MQNYIPLLIAIALALWAAGALRLSRAAQPLRLKLAEEGQRLLASPVLSAAQKDMVRYQLSTAFGHRITLLAGMVVIPIFALVILFESSVLDKAAKRNWVDDPETRTRYHHLRRLHNRLSLLNHPILSLILDFEITLFIAPAIVIAAALRGTSTEKVNHDSAMSIVDEKAIQFRRRIPTFSAAPC